MISMTNPKVHLERSVSELSLPESVMGFSIKFDRLDICWVDDDD